MYVTSLNVQKHFQGKNHASFQKTSGYITQNSYQMHSVQSPEQNVMRENFSHYRDILPPDGPRKKMLIQGANNDGNWELSTNMGREEFERYIAHMKQSAQKLFPLGEIMQAKELLNQANFYESVLTDGNIRFNSGKSFLKVV